MTETNCLIQSCNVKEIPLPLTQDSNPCALACLVQESTNKNFIDMKIAWVDTSSTIHSLSLNHSFPWPSSTNGASSSRMSVQVRNQESEQFIESVTEPLQVTFIPFEGLLQSSGWGTFVAAFSELLGAVDAVHNSKLHQNHAAAALSPETKSVSQGLSTDSPRTPVLKASPPAVRVWQTAVRRATPEPKKIAAKKDESSEDDSKESEDEAPAKKAAAPAPAKKATPEPKKAAAKKHDCPEATTVDTSNFSPLKRISSVQEAGKMARAWVEWMEEGAERSRQRIIIKTMSRCANIKKCKVPSASCGLCSCNSVPPCICLAVSESGPSRREDTSMGVILHSLFGDGGQIVNAWLQKVYQARRCRNLLRNALWRLHKLQVLYVGVKSTLSCVVVDLC